jgi:hypothetical protein
MSDVTTDVTFDAPGGWPQVDLLPGPDSGWNPPATIGGTWCRVSPEGVYETWPRDPTRHVLIATPEATDQLIDVRPLRQ